MNQPIQNPPGSPESQARLSPDQRRIIRLLIDTIPETLPVINRDPGLRFIAQRLIKLYRADLLSRLGNALATSLSGA
jgi:hypothetical protein